jgi:hypothetical protein
VEAGNLEGGLHRARGRRCMMMMIMLLLFMLWKTDETWENQDQVARV